MDNETFAIIKQLRENNIKLESMLRECRNDLEELRKEVITEFPNGYSIVLKGLRK